jgi:hypothetical protein
LPKKTAISLPTVKVTEIAKYLVRVMAIEKLKEKAREILMNSG